MTFPAGAWRGHAKDSRGYRLVLLALFAAGFTTFAQVFSVQAVIPAISADLDLEPATASLSLSYATLGMALAVLPWASIADRLGRVATMRWSLVIATVVGLATPFMPTFELLLVSRALLGIALGAVPAVSMAYLTEEIHAPHIAAAAATYVAGNTFGGIVGRVVAGALAGAEDWRIGLTAVAMIAAGMAVLFLLLVPPARGYRPRRSSLRETTRAIGFNLRDPLTASVYLVGFLNMGGFAALYNYVGYRLTGAPLAVSSSLVSLVFVVYLFGTAAARFSARLAARIGSLRTMVLGFALEAVGAALTLVDSTAVVIGGLAVFTIGCFLIQPIAGAQSGTGAQVGRAQSSALFQLSWLVGASVLGWMVGVVMRVAGWHGAVATLVLVAIAGSIVAWVGAELLKDRRPSPRAI